MSITPLQALQAAHWQISEDGKAIEKRYILDSFDAAIAMLNQIADLARQQNHHPDLRNVHHKLWVRISSYDVDALTERDIKLATHIQALRG